LFCDNEANDGYQQVHIDLAMTLASEVQQIEASLAGLHAGLGTFEKRSQRTITSDRASMLECLQQSVLSVRNTVLLLEPGNGTSGLLTCEPDERTSITTTQIERHATEMESKFGQLRLTAEDGLSNLNTINVKCHDYEAELQGLNTDLANLNSRILGSLVATHKRHERKKLEVKEAQNSMEEAEMKLQALEANMAERKEIRNLVRFVGCPELLPSARVELTKL
jgi:hypothetical protein